MRTPSVVGLVGAVVLAQGCGGKPDVPVVVRPPPLVVTGTPPPPSRSHWVFPDRSTRFAGKLDLGADGVLYVGSHGRREILKGEDAPVDAPTLALDDLVGVLRDAQGQFVFVGDDGDTFVSKDALGAITTTRPGPFAGQKPPVRVQSLAVGKAVIVAVSPVDGSLVRSTDFGATYQPVAYGGAQKPFGRAASVALDGKGNGLLVHLPQRVYVTHDDGATWSPIASPGIGARRATREGDDKLVLEGMGGQRAKLDGNALAITTEPPAPVFKPNAKTATIPRSPGLDRVRSTRVLAGDRVVDFTALAKRSGEVKEIEIAVAKLGEKAEKPFGNAELVGREGLSTHIAAWNNAMLYLRDDEEADSASPTRTVFASTDYGATWTKGATLEGGEIEGSVDVTLGPKGWAFIPALCSYGERYGGGDDEGEGEEGGGSSDCGKRQIRPAGASAFEDMVFSEDFTPEQFTFDEAHDKVYVLGTHQGEKHLYESPLSSNKFVRTKLLDGVQGDLRGMSVDAKGALRLFTYQWGTGWTVLRHDGKDTSKRYLSLDNGQLSFVGARGLLLAQHNHGWETADGGETWVRIATNGALNADCSEAGCIGNGAIRVGWDLPAAAGDEKVTASNDPPPKTTPQNPPPQTQSSASVAPPQLTLACKSAGATALLGYMPGVDTVDARPEVRWVQFEHGDGAKLSAWVGGKTAARELAIFPATPKKVPNAKTPDNTEYRTGERPLADGFVAARYSFQSRASTGTFNPVDIEIAWVSYATGKLQRKKLPQHAPFRVPGYGFAGDAQLVPGGLLYRATSGEPVTFIHDDGKTETIPLAGDASPRNAVRVGPRWLLEDADWGTSRLTWSDDAGKSWKKKAWTLDDSSTAIALVTLGGKQALSMSKGGGAPVALFAVDANVPDDPPAPTVLSYASINGACDAQAGNLRFQASVPNRTNLKVRLEAAKGKDPIELTPSTRVAHVTATGGCTTAYQLTGAETAFLYADGPDRWSAWRFRKSDDAKKPGTIAEPLSCAAQK